MSHPLSPAVVSGLAGMVAFIFTLVLTPIVRTVAVRAGWIAKPTDVRWGRRVVARLGGAAMFGGFLAALASMSPWATPPLALMIGLVLVVLLGLVDDIRRLPPYTKLLCQLLIGCVVVLGGLRIQLDQWPGLSIPLSVLWYVLIMNSFNLLDNMDGLAAGVGAIVAGFCALHAALAQQWAIVVLAGALCGSCLGFLWFNFPPAKIYMGDSGSHFLGLSVAAFALMGTWRHSTQLIGILSVPTFVLAVPIFDTCFVTLQRVLHRQHPFVGGIDHVSHRLAILGLTTRQTVLVLYGVSASLGLLSVISAGLRPLPSFATWLCVLATLVLIGRYLARVNVYELEPRPDRRETWERDRSLTVIETMLLHKRRLLEILVDFCLLTCVYVFAHLLRFEGTIPTEFVYLIPRSLPIILIFKLICFAACGLYRGLWRYMGLSDVIVIFKAVVLGSVLSSLALLYLWRFEGFSRAVLIIDGMLSFMAIGGSRVIERLLDEWIRGASVRGVPTLIIGAGDTGAMLLRSLKYDPPPGRRIIGFLDDDIRKQGSRLHGVPLLGSRARLPELIELYGVREVLVAISDPPGDLLEYVRQSCAPRSVTWRIARGGMAAAV